MSQLFGDKLFSRSAWGSRELFQTFGFEGASKTSLNAIDAGRELLNHMIKKQKWVHLGDILNTLYDLITDRSPTTNYDVLHGELQAFWNEYSVIMEGETPNELAILALLLSNIKEDFQSSTSVGRVKLLRSFLQHSLNNFKVI